MITRRQLFSLLTGAAAVAVMPALASSGFGAVVAVATPTGTLLPLDGSVVAVKDYPALAECLLECEADWLRRADELVRNYATTDVRDYDGASHGGCGMYSGMFHDGNDPESDAINSYISNKQSDLESARSRHQPILSEDGQLLRLPNARAEGERFHGYGADDTEVWGTYKTYIQALPNGDLPVGARFAVIDSIKTKSFVPVS